MTNTNTDRATDNADAQRRAVSDDLEKISRALEEEVVIQAIRQAADFDGDGQIDEWEKDFFNKIENNDNGTFRDELDSLVKIKSVIGRDDDGNISEERAENLEKFFDYDNDGVFSKKEISVVHGLALLDGDAKLTQDDIDLYKEAKSDGSGYTEEDLIEISNNRSELDATADAAYRSIGIDTGIQ
jgi:hypothetical protein